MAFLRQASRPAFVSLTISALFVCARAESVPEAMPEHQVKAAFVYNFAKFVQWPPADPKEPFTFCLLGKDPFRGTLDELVNGKLLNGRPALVVHVSSAWQAKTCPVLVIGQMPSAAVAEVLRGLGDSPVLTVSETQGFLDAGGAIQLLVDDQKVRFEVNAEPARRARLQISSRLMRLARSVRP
jgi:uncharacterized protein DUF4154